MKGYEVVFVIDGSATEEARNATLAKLRSTVTRYNGTLHYEYHWGNRRLAYPIRKKDHGVYYVWYISGVGSTIDELNIQFRYSTEILRSQVIRSEDIEEDRQFFLSISTGKSKQTSAEDELGEKVIDEVEESIEAA